MRKGYAGLVLIVALCAACSDDDDEKTSVRTIQAQCADVMQPICEMLIACGNSGTVADCVSSGVPVCCGSYCDSAAISSEAAIRQCQEAARTISCAQLNVSFPPECKGVVLRPASLDPPVNSPGLP